MDPSLLKHSTKYPAGYGDFALHCSDNVICYFPRHLLEYMSPVFKDMFSLAAEGIDSVAIGKLPQPPLTLTESSAVIETLLEHIDPKSKRNLIIDPNTIFELLEAARKYQVSAITEWFTDEAPLHQRDGSSGKSVFLQPFISTHPDLALQCAIRFDCPMVGRQALRELAGSDSPKPQLKSTDIQSIAYICQQKLRETHVARYQSYISTLLAHLKAGKGNKDTCATCGSCRDFLSGWFLDMERAIMISPRWRSFSQAFKQDQRCLLPSCVSPSNWDYFLRGSVDVWEKEAMKLEDALPEWPFVDHSCTFS